MSTASFCRFPLFCIICAAVTFFVMKTASTTFAVSTVESVINLIQNPSNEDELIDGEIPHWIEVVGENWTQRSENPEPQDGNAYFFAGEGENAELTQAIDVSAYASSIDHGRQLFEFAGYVRAWPQSPADSSRVILEYKNGTGQILDSYDSGEVSTVSQWELIKNVGLAPAGTRTISVRLISTRYNGSNNDGYFDNLLLRPFPSCLPQDCVMIYLPMLVTE